MTTIRARWSWLVVVACCGCARLSCNGAEESLPAPPPEAAGLPPGLDDMLEHDDAGRAILVSIEAVGLPGYRFAVELDPTLDDPIERWGGCLGRITACYRVNGTRPVDGCINKLEVCADDTGGPGCCPPACFAAYRALRAQGVAEDDAVRQSFLVGTCVKGLAEQLAGDDGGVQP